jgi:hypothetical protein
LPSGVAGEAAIAVEIGRTVSVGSEEQPANTTVQTSSQPKRRNACKPRFSPMKTPFSAGVLVFV